MMKRFIVLSLLSVFLLSACSNTEDVLSGKTFDISYTAPDNPDKYYSIMTLEFLNGKITTDMIDGEKGIYEIKDNNLVIKFENDNEKLDITFTAQGEDDSNKYSAVVSDSNLQIEDSNQVSKYKALYNKLPSFPIEFIKK